MTRSELARELAATLGARQRHEARFIVDHVLGAGASASRGVTDDETAAARLMVARRLDGEPLQYVLGEWSFRALDVSVDRRVLIPRPETEQVVEVALGELRRLARDGGVKNPVLVDAGTGSGVIALSLATEAPRDFPQGEGKVWATDASADALDLAAQNIDRVRTRHAGRMFPVVLLEGDWLEVLPGELLGSVHLIVSNPPYVAPEEWVDLPDEVRREPRQALVAGPGSDGTPGLHGVEDVLTQSMKWLAPSGSVVIELAPHQADSAAHMAKSVGYTDVWVAPDLAQRARALVARPG